MRTDIGRGNGAGQPEGGRPRPQPGLPYVYIVYCLLVCLLAPLAQLLRPLSSCPLPSPHLTNESPLQTFLAPFPSFLPLPPFPPCAPLPHLLPLTRTCRDRTPIRSGRQDACQRGAPLPRRRARVRCRRVPRGEFRETMEECCENRGRGGGSGGKGSPGSCANSRCSLCLRGSDNDSLERSLVCLSVCQQWKAAATANKAKTVGV